MEWASPLSDLVKCFWGLAGKPLCSIYNLRDNVNSLLSATDGLQAVRDDVRARVAREEEGGRARRTNQVVNWLGMVQDLELEVDQVRQETRERDQIKCVSHCLPRNCWSSYKLGKRVDQLLNEARELQHKRGEISDFALTLPPPPQVFEMSIDQTVGLERSLNEVWNWLVDENEGVIGLYGTGGVGKTALMEVIKEKLSHANHGFEVVIWVVVSRQANEDSIRDAIRKKLDIEDESWEARSRDDRVRHLLEVLTQKKFVLLIDDLWATLDLSNIGVPRPGPESQSKVVFTTRSAQVCRQMGAGKMFEVQCLTPEEALALFEKYVGQPTVDSHPEIPELANDIAQECKGLPLALITVGRAMAGISNPLEWEHVLTTLRKNPHRLTGMEEEVYYKLELSYDRLNDSTLQRCFLYCCLFPEDYHIRLHDLIGLWIGGGLLGDTRDVYSLRNEGEYFLGRLKRACLLESRLDSAREEYVKMHDVIRDMATWIARDHGRRENKLLVIERDEDISEEMISRWREAKKVCIWGKWIQNINRIPSRCSQLETLFVRETEVTFVPRGFFDSMRAHLTVLDLSDNKHIESFPERICNLINLRYLNLSATGISELPRKIKNLTRLRWLLLGNMSNDILIPTRAITSLPLNVFSCWSYQGSFLQLGQVMEEEMVEELGRMRHLTDLSISVRESSSAQKIFESPNLRRRVRRACIGNRNGNLTSIVITHSSAHTDGFSHLETLHLLSCTGLREMKITQGVGRAPNCSCFPNLVDVKVYGCKLSDLSWLVHAPKLRKLRVQKCNLMERIIGDGFAREELADSGLFLRLESLELIKLPNLTSICDQALSFPQRVIFCVRECPGLRRLPFDSSSARGGFKVDGDQRWWAEFEWDPTARVTLDVGDMDPGEEMTFGEAMREVRDDHWYLAKIGFLPRGVGNRPSERAS